MRLDGTSELEELEAERVELMVELTRVARQQKKLDGDMRKLEKSMRNAVNRSHGYEVPDDQDLTLEDVEAWCRSEFFNLAHTMLSNPHCYFNRGKVKSESMYERAVAYVLEHGYRQRYGRSEYTVLDVRMNYTSWFLWPMTTVPAESQVLNLKPAVLRPVNGQDPVV